MQLNYFHAKAIFIAGSIKMMACMCVTEKMHKKREVICLITNTITVKTQKQEKKSI